MNLSNYGWTEDIGVAPLINLEELQPSYDETIENIEDYKQESEKDLVQYKPETKNNLQASLSILNKITAKVNKFTINLKENYEYEDLRIYIIDCYISKPQEKKETAIYLNIYNNESNKKIFNGWMIKSLPSISSMEHPIYDIWVDNCEGL